MARAPETSSPELNGVIAGARAHDTLLRDLFKGVIPLLAQPDVPLPIKILVAGFIFIGIYTSALLVILLADVATSFTSRQIDVRAYLEFLGGTLAVLLLMISIGARAALRFENEKTLEANMHTITLARRQRSKPQPAAPGQ